MACTMRPKRSGISAWLPIRTGGNATKVPSGRHQIVMETLFHDEKHKYIVIEVMEDLWLRDFLRYLLVGSCM